MRGALRDTVKYLLWTQLAFSTQIFQKCSTQVYVLSQILFINKHINPIPT